MLTNIAIVLGLVAVAGLFFWLAKRAFRLRKPAARWVLVVFAALPGVVVALVTGVVVFGYTRMCTCPAPSQRSTSISYPRQPLWRAASTLPSPTAWLAIRLTIPCH